MRVHRKHIAVAYIGFENMLIIIRLKIIITIFYLLSIDLLFSFRSTGAYLHKSKSDALGFNNTLPRKIRFDIIQFRLCTFKHLLRGYILCISLSLS